MRRTRVWARLLGLGAAVVEDVFFSTEGEVVVRARPRWHERDRCGVCRRRCPGFDLGEGRRRWRAPDLGLAQAFVEADAPRVSCPQHGVVVCAVPWARHQARFTRCFEDQVAWLAVHCSKSATAELMRVAWRTVGSIVERVVAETGRHVDLLAGLGRIGIDEISHRRGQRYLTVVIDHDSGRLVWAAPGRDRRTVEAFLDALGPSAASGSGWSQRTWPPGSPARSGSAARTPCCASTPSTSCRRPPTRWTRCAARCGTRPARRARTLARRLKGARFALWKNPENLTAGQDAKLAQIQKTNRRLYRAYLLKEQLRQIYRLEPAPAIALLDAWIAWARRCRLPSFVKLARTISAQRPGIAAAIEHGLSNARVEAANTTIRLIARRAFGFHTADALIALAKLTLSGLCPPLPGRVT